jgi:tetratricopeptide (TPR) repeat protein
VTGILSASPRRVSENAGTDAGETKLQPGLRGARRLAGRVACIALLMVWCGAAFADDVADCANSRLPADVGIAACDRLIQAGNLQDRALATAYGGRGAAHLLKGETDQAIADFGEAIRLNPKSASAFNSRGDAWLHKGDLDRALADFDQAIGLNPSYAQPHLNRGLVFERKGDLDRAIAEQDEAIRIDPRYASAYNNRGYYFDLKGDRDRAIADLDVAISLAPKFARAFRNRGRAWEHKGDLDRAIADFDSAIGIEPNNVSNLGERGNAHRIKHDFDAAIADFSNAIRIDPDNALVRRGLGRVYEDKRDFDRAIAEYGEAIRLDRNDASAHFRRAFVLRHKGSIDSALADYNEAIRLNPADPLAFNNRGSIFRAKGNLDRAIADFTEAIRLDPAYPGALTNRGLAYESAGDAAHALADFQAAVALPLKYDNGKWARDTAQSRLAVLSQPTVTPSPSATPTAPPPTPVVPPKGATPREQPSVTPPTPVASNIILPKGQFAARLALVIGNGLYRNAPQLPNPPNDARAVAKTLRDIGFQVIEATDLDRSGMEKALLEFLQRAPTASLRVLFYAGHGISIDGNNYLVPVDATVANKSSAMFELIDIDRILKGLDDEARANVIILDACRDNPFEPRLAPSRSVSRGAGLVAYQSVGSGTLIAFATAPGNTAADGTGVHSPFTTALLKNIGTQGVEVNQMLTRVRIDVAAATERKQIPWVNSSLLGDVYLGSPEQRPKRQ